MTLSASLGAVNELVADYTLKILRRLSSNVINCITNNLLKVSFVFLNLNLFKVRNLLKFLKSEGVVLVELGVYRYLAFHFKLINNCWNYFPSLYSI